MQHYKIKNCAGFGSNQSGFSLIELVVVIVIISIVAAIATPNIDKLLKSQRNKENVQILSSAFRQARTESLLRSQDITVAVSNSEVVLSGGVYEYQDLNNQSGNVIAKFPLKKGTDIQKNNHAKNIVFKANKTVPISGLAVFTISCDEEGSKAGRKVTVDNNGNIGVSNEGSQC